RIQEGLMATYPETGVANAGTERAESSSSPVRHTHVYPQLIPISHQRVHHSSGLRFWGYVWQLSRFMFWTAFTTGIVGFVYQRYSTGEFRFLKADAVDIGLMVAGYAGFGLLAGAIFWCVYRIALYSLSK